MLLPARVRPVRSLVPAIVTASAAACVIAAMGLIAALAARPAPAQRACVVPEGYELVRVEAEPLPPPPRVKIPAQQFAPPPPARRISCE